MSNCYTSALYLNNLRAVVAQASPEDIEDGLTWYDDARTFARTLANTLSPYYGDLHTRMQRAAGIIAVLSPRQTWAKNKYCASRVVELWDRGEIELVLALPVFSANLEKALRLMGPAFGSEVVDACVRGPKVRAFYENIMGSTLHLTLDTHAINACRGEYTHTPKAPKSAERQAMHNAYTALADEHGWTLPQAQAIVWVTWRHIAHGTSHNLG